MIGRLRAPRLESLFVAALVLFGFRIGAKPIEDNSMFTHLRTGIDMVAGAGIPRHDRYSYTARGTRWVVQSWLPEWTYGWAFRIGDRLGDANTGFRLVVFEQALLVSLLALLVIRLARAGSPLRTALAGGVAVGVGAAFWVPRPLLFGLICMALTIGIVERRRSPWLLIPVVWVWVNSHGSFPLGLVWLGARAVGEAVDWKSIPRETSRYFWWFGAGLVVSIINPLGARLLTFPLTLGEKREAFQNIIEWESPDFQSSSGRFALIFIVLGLLFLLRARLSWRDVVPSVVFFGSILLAMRNIPVAAVVLAPVLGRALGRPDEAPVARAEDNSARRRLNLGLLTVIAAAFVFFAMSITVRDPLNFKVYPVEAAAFMERQGFLDSKRHRMVHQDYVGNYLELRYGRKVSVFIDDRYDMYPLSMSHDYTSLVRGQKDALEVLDRHRADVVLWDHRLPLVTILRSDDWKELFRKGDWVVMQRP